MGCIYLRGNIWWIKYSRRGKPYFESSKSTKDSDGKRLLKKREGEIVDGKLPGVVYDRVKWDELVEGLRLDYKINNPKSVTRLNSALKHLEGFFEGLRAPEVTTARVQAYTAQRMDEGAEAATINLELTMLGRMYSLGARQTPPKVAMVPYIPKLKVNNVITDYYEHQDYLNLLALLADYLKPVLTFGYKTGWRKSEILNLTWDRVDLSEGTVTLEVGTTKNKEGRTVYLDPELLTLLKAQHAGRRLGCPYVFHREGNQIKEFRVSWKSACKKAGLEGRFFHDLRRTAVRNMIRAGIPEVVAMKISGHKTRAIFDRYNITSSDDLKQAAARLDAHLQGLGVTKTVTIGKEGKKSKAQVVNFPT
ncbi:MAG: tyrosine-type recombinase/integrase [Candidatus Thorarchaeota archaeon]|jgi:integrase